MPRLVVLLVLLLTPVFSAAQPTLPAVPVRYDTDLLPPAFHQGRRAAVKASLPENAVAIFFSAPERNRLNDSDFEYMQDADLYYLTGTHEPNTVLILAPGGLTVEGESVTELLLVPPRTDYSDVWLGRRFGTERAEVELGIEKAVSNERFGEIMADLSASDKRFYHLSLPGGVAARSDLADQLDAFRQHVETLEMTGNFLVRQATRAMLTIDDPQQFEQIKTMAAGRLRAEDFNEPVLQEAFRTFTSSDFDAWQAWKAEHLDSAYADGATLQGLLAEMRSIKTEEELALLQRAIDITGAAHREAMRSLEPGMHEYELEALVEYVFHRNGAESPGFPSIVGSAENSTILHYNTNRRQMQADEVVVLDIGAEYHGYTADVTRTLPVDGTFSEEQRAIYEIVLAAQNAAIDLARAGQPYGSGNEEAGRIITEGLERLGILKPDGDMRAFFMHGTSHYLGLYVHDVGDYGPLRPGQVITVEPGIYISPSENVDPKWWNIGVRIEDDVLITDGDPVMMSGSAPRTVEEIEALMRERGLGNDPAGQIGTN